MTLFDFNNQPVEEPVIPLLPEHTIRWIFDPESTEPPFAYTVGLAARPGRAYELATVGLSGELAHVIITCVAEQLVNDGLDPAEGLELDEVLHGYLVRLRRVTDTAKCTGARELYGPQVTVWQVLIPDKWGHLPGDPHYTEAAYAQPFM
ncbi:DUF4262 domain-containing protein [Streptomyces sp. NPDC003016]